MNGSLLKNRFISLKEIYYFELHVTTSTEYSFKCFDDSIRVSLKLKPHVDLITFMSSSQSKTYQSPITSRVSSSVHTACQYSSAKGTFIDWFQLGLSSLLGSAQACSNNR